MPLNVTPPGRPFGFDETMIEALLQLVELELRRLVLPHEVDKTTVLHGDGV